MKTHNRKVSPLRALFEIIAIAALIFHLVTVARAWSSLPSQVPVHFGISGHPDKWESKQELWVLPALSFIFYLGLSVLARYPHKFNYPWQVTPSNAERQYQLAATLVSALKAETMCLFAIITWQSIRVAMNLSAGLGGFIPIVIAVSTLTIVVYLWLALRAS